MKLGKNINLHILKSYSVNNFKTEKKGIFITHQRAFACEWLYWNLPNAYVRTRVEAFVKTPFEGVLAHLPGYSVLSISIMILILNFFITVG